MFFAVSKIVWGLLSPLNFLLVLFATGGGLYTAGFARLGRALLAAALLLFVVPGAVPLGPDLLAGLEQSFQRPQKLPEHVDGIIVLGGAFETRLSAVYGFPVVNDNIERVLDGVMLARIYPRAKLVFSGGEGTLRLNHRTEAEDSALLLQQIGFVSRNVVYEDKSRNTVENLAFTRKLVSPQPGQTWILVTSAYHMKRAMILARKTGWGPELVPWPTDYRTDGRFKIIPQNFDVEWNFYAADIALHEYAGILAENIAFPPVWK